MEVVLVHNKGQFFRFTFASFNSGSLRVRNVFFLWWSMFRGPLCGECMSSMGRTVAAPLLDR